MRLIESIKRLELHCVRERVAPYAQCVSHSRDVVRVLSALIGKYDHERMVALLLDAKNRCFGYGQVAQGGVSACAITPADLYRLAVHMGATSVILAHNHPSEDPEPSEADIAVTKRLSEAGTLLGIRLLDHLIVTSDPTHYRSLADMGLL